MKDSAYAEALNKEREGYVAKGQKDRVAEVDAELKRLGQPASPAADPVVIDGETVDIDALDKADLAPYADKLGVEVKDSSRAAGIRRAIRAALAGS